MSKILADDFIGMYPVSKTLRFELRPIGKTREYIERDGIIDTDTARSENYIKVKAIIDEYHKAFIQKVLGGIRLEGLDTYYRLYNTVKRNTSEEKEYTKCKDNLRKQIAKAFKEDEAFKSIDKKELFKDDLPHFLAEDSEKLTLIEGFSEFTSYFTGFHQNRQNMYSDEEKSTAIAFRVVNQNIPKYFDNMKVFDRIAETSIFDQIADLEVKLNDIYSDLGKIEDYFSVNGFNRVISQAGIDKYNTILGGYSLESGRKVQGLNELVNLYNQKNKERLPKFKLLFKQILSDRDSMSFIPDQFFSDAEVFEAVQTVYYNLNETIIKSSESLSVENLFTNISAFDLSGIFVSNDSSITTISQELYGDWSIIKNAIEQRYEKENPSGNKNKEKYEEKKLSELKKIKSYSIAGLNELIREYGQEGHLEKYFTDRVEKALIGIESAYQAYTQINTGRYASGSALKGNDTDIIKIKGLLDGFKELQWAIKPLIAGFEEAGKDETFYGEYVRIWDALDVVIPLYNKVRNYVTGKPYSTEKVKLNFGKPTLLNGWDKNKERDNLGIIMMKDGYYYLGIMNRNSTKCIDEAPIAESKDVYQKMNYKLLPGPNKMLPKVFFSKSRIEEFAPSPEIVECYKKGTHKKGENFNLDDCHRLIDFFKASIEKHEDWSQFGFHFSDTDKYLDISEFYREISQQGYKINYTDIDASYIDKLTSEGSLYLFQIYSKDFSHYSKGTPNLHTLYWTTLFSEKNLADVVYKLNGEAEVFFRKASIRQEDIIVHPAGREVVNKDPLNEKKTSLFKYDIIKDRRYTCDKFVFHVPITMNFKVEEERYINQRVNCAIHDAKDLHIIGIDRGERNLLYISVIDLNGNIIEQMSLNEILSYDKDRKIHRRDYHQMLTTREKENVAARQNWTTINTIKELKEGYLSQVVHVITDLMIKYNAIVALEDLNFGFKRGRQKFERQVYQKFEKMLIDKLNYYVDKQKHPEENGGLLHAYQLTGKFNSFQTLGKQSGFLYYVPAWNTSKIDPTTGFTNLFYTRYESIEKTKTFIRNMDKIFYDKETNTYALTFDYNRFTYKAEGTRTKWTLYTYGRRIDHFRNKEKNSEWDVKQIDIAQAFSDLLTEYGISSNGSDIREKMLNVESADFFRRFMKIMSLLVQMRNSDEKAGIDEIISPVMNSKGAFYTTGCGDNIPTDADANGAYNIAKKGLWLVKRIKETPKDEMRNVKLAMTNKEWLSFAQEMTL